VIGHVAGGEVHVVALFLHLGLPGLALLGTRGAGDDRAAGVGQGLADGGADTTGATGDECNAVAHVFSPFVKSFGWDAGASCGKCGPGQRCCPLPRTRILDHLSLKG
jgi:hypothetical protein